MRRVTLIAVSLLALSVIPAALSSSSTSGTASTSATASRSASTLSPDATPADAPDGSPVDTTGWTTYVSKRYGFAIGHPPAWTVHPSDHDWTMEADSRSFDSTSHEAFVSPAGDIRVSAWSTPSSAPEGPEGPEAYEAVMSWAKQYCQASTNSSCTGIRDRAVPLCNTSRLCYPGLLLPFEEDVQALFTVGNAQQRLIIVAVWRPEQHPTVRPAGSRALLEAFLATMDVCPNVRSRDPSGCPGARAGAVTGDPLTAA